MVFLWFLLLLGWPIAEIWIFVETGRAIGWLGAIGLGIATSLAGAVLMRIQGFNALNRFLEGAERGELPMSTIVDGMGIFLAGVLLMLPGFLSDVIGLLLFIPPLRRPLTAWLFRQILRSPMPRREWRGRGPGAAPRPESARPGAGAKGFRRAENVIDAEFETIEPRPKPGRRKPTDK
jgi:UPF0716 protein FxsA